MFHRQKLCVLVLTLLSACSLVSTESRGADGEVVKKVIQAGEAGGNLLRPDAWQPWREGFEREGQVFVCDNGSDAQIQRGASQTVTLNQRVAEPIVATVESRCQGVTGSADSNYALYLDLVYTDGTPLWGQAAPFDTGTHPWQARRVVVVPEKPVRQVAVHLLMRGHGGTASFRDPTLQVLPTPAGATRFDGVAVTVERPAAAGFQVRDVAADSDFVEIRRRALGLELTSRQWQEGDATCFDVTLADTTGRDRAVTLLYAVPAAANDLIWLEDPRRSVPVEAGREYAHTSRFSQVGANGRLSLYPFGGVADAGRGIALGIDMLHPAFYRVSYNGGTGELYLAYDLGLTPQKPQAHVRFCQFPFDPQQRFRGALARYYALFPDAFRCRTPEQGLWMPFAKISEVTDWRDFGFKFKEGADETSWDDDHDIITFRYTEPLTWWMTMPKDVPRTLEAARNYASQLADEQRDPHAQALFTSGYHDSAGRLAARMLDTPWCNGAVWSMNSMPGIQGSPTDFQLKWNDALKQRLYGPDRQGNLDGEYIDSSEGYVTDELDYCRAHFADAVTPLTFGMHTRQPAVFRGLIAFEYVQRIASDIHDMNHLMMANATPIRLCWLAPLLEVMGTETDWHPNGQWRPMTDGELLYRRAMCKGKPYCFLMNTRFEDFPSELVEKYMKRALAYGMFPGFFSHNAAEGHYFTRPEMYNRDRPLFKKYVPLCRTVAEAGWEPLTRATSSDEQVIVERFGDRYLTVFNDSQQARSVRISTELPTGSNSRELVTGRPLAWTHGALELELGAEDVAVIDLQ